MTILRICRGGEEERFCETNHDKNTNRRLIWHGSDAANFCGILTQGLRIAPPEADATGYMVCMSSS